MAEHFLELAALSTLAIPGLDVVGGADYSSDGAGDFDAAVLRTGDRRVLIARRPRSEAAAQEQLAQRRALAAMTPGVRARLPFRVPMAVGDYVEGGQRMGLYEFIPGSTANLVALDADSELALEIARGIAAIHALPTAVVDDAGLPRLRAHQARDVAAGLVERALGTGRLPAALEDRWKTALADPALWDFGPTVVHGSLSLESIVTNGAGVTGILGWSDLRVGDPAIDLHWLQTANPAVGRAVFDEYVDARGVAVDRQIRRRALLYAELELARWLVHGVATGEKSIIGDAEQMLDDLVARVRRTDARLVHETLPVLDLDQVQELLAAAARSRGHVAHPVEDPTRDDVGRVELGVRYRDDPPTGRDPD